MVVGAADHVNHAVVTFEEASAALPRLVALGLVRVRRGRFAVSARVAAALPKGRSAVHTDLRRVEKLLAATKQPARRGRPFELERAAFDAAVKRYLER